MKRHKVTVDLSEEDYQKLKELHDCSVIDEVLGRVQGAMKQLGLEDEYKKEFDVSKLDSYIEVLVEASKYFNEKYGI
jgi:hypothetical protein